VRAEFWAELIYEYDYSVNRIKVEVTIRDCVPNLMQKYLENKYD